MQSRCNGYCNDNDDYDFIVVGMGAAGSLMLRQLSDANFSVMGIEAGYNADSDPLILNSTNAGILEANYTWKFFYNQETVPNDDVDGMVMNYTTGRLLGGGTSINGLQYVRGSKQFWDNWAATINDSTWNGEAAAKGYKKLEKFVGVQGHNKSYIHGHHGKMQIRQAPTISTSMATKFITALATATDSQIIDDYNDPVTPIGTFARWSLFEQPNGNRANSSVNFLQDIVDKNGNSLHRSRRVKICLNTTVDRIKFDKHRRIEGLEVITNGKSKFLRAKHEIILCAGIHSNEILQRSGIGDANVLRPLGIKVIYDNPLVGANSRNHLISMATFSANVADSPGNPDDPNALYTGGAFLPNPGDTSNKRGFQWIGIDGGPGILMVAFYNLDPQSTGTDRIQNKDPFRVSAVSEHLLSDGIDLDRIVNVYQQQITALNTVFTSNPDYDGYALIEPSLDIINDTDALKKYIMLNIDHSHHWAGTCKMGVVVNSRGVVYGVEGLRVADISVAPIQPDGNTAGPAYFVSYNIAKKIIADYN